MIQAFNLLTPGGYVPAVISNGRLLQNGAPFTGTLEVIGRRGQYSLEFSNGSPAPGTYEVLVTLYDHATEKVVGGYLILQADPYGHLSTQTWQTNHCRPLSQT